MEAVKCVSDSHQQLLKPSRCYWYSAFFIKYYIFPHQISALFNLSIFIYLSERFYSIPLIAKARGRWELLCVSGISLLCLAAFTYIIPYEILLVLGPMMYVANAVSVQSVFYIAMEVVQLSFNKVKMIIF